MLRIIPILLGVTISYAAALILNAVGMTNADGSAILDFSGAAAANLVGLPPFQLCKFNLTAILAMAPIAIAAIDGAYRRYFRYLCYGRRELHGRSRTAAHTDR